MDYISVFATVDGLGLDGDCIQGKVSLREIETKAVVTVGRLHIER